MATYYINLFTSMTQKNIVFIAQSLDGYIADKNGDIDWLNTIPNPNHIDMGYKQLMENIQAIVMGRVTFETVSKFDGPWPYNKPVYVLSNTLKVVPKPYKGKVFLLSGKPAEVVHYLRQKNYHKLYIDGGTTIQQFLQAKLINELIITTIPILLGGGYTLFGELTTPLHLQHLKTTVFLNQIVQSHYKCKI